MKSLMRIILGYNGALKSKGEVDPGIVLGLILTILAMVLIFFVVKNMAVGPQP